MYLFTTAPLSDATTARLGSDMLENLPLGTPLPDNCRTVPLQIASGASQAQLERLLGAKAQKETGCTKSLCLVTSGSADDAREGFFIGFSGGNDSLFGRNKATSGPAALAATVMNKFARSTAKENQQREEATSELSQNFRVGMKMGDVQKMLGSPTRQQSGGDVLGMFGGVSGSAGGISAFSQRAFVVWERPEGNYKLAFVGDELVEIYSTP